MLTITSNSIDELNQLYRQLKHNYIAQGKIQLNTESMHYQLLLEKKSLNPVVKNLSEKTFEWCEEDWKKLSPQSMDDLMPLLKIHQTIPFIHQLLEQMEDMSYSQKQEIYLYFVALGEEAADIPTP